ncbi:MAG: GMP synthase (glutamine-hydrolysing) [Parcubacteria group bacterium Gr01-1014_20]|nr:MAG: GMP synthase (glutamine-hydrolysing) [Parcubacteria group bacterium Gr01-1014_20]
MVLVLNFGSQFAHLIARRVRDLGVRAEILRFDVPALKIQELKPAGIILSGGPASVLEKGSPRPDRRIFDLGVPILGICYGEQVIAEMLGGKVKAGTRREFGKETLSVLDRTGIFLGLSKEETVWFSHGDQVTGLPKGFIRLASTLGCPNAGVADLKRRIWGVQFHPEVTHTVSGIRIISNFVFQVCRAKQDWKIASVRSGLTQSLKRKIGENHILVGVSGGVDSLVVATLLNEAVGGSCHAVFVDTGLLRKGEAEQVVKVFKDLRLKNFHLLGAKDLFLKRLQGVTDPEKKRKIIGHTFIEVFEKFIKTKLSKHKIKYFAQGTIYPDRIESAEPGGHASKIKSHHNLTLPAKLGFEVVEPIRDLYKDEVRRLGKLLGLPKDLLWRHPFPGPGLAVRIVGEVTPDRLRILREADSIYMEELEGAGEYEKIWQAFAVLLPLKTVGVMGDARTYEYMISLRAVDSVDGMSADWHKMPVEVLEKVSSRIVREVRGVNRVLYDVTQKPPATVEYE